MNAQADNTTIYQLISDLDCVRLILGSCNALGRAPLQDGDGSQNLEFEDAVRTLRVDLTQTLCPFAQEFLKILKDK